MVEVRNLYHILIRKSEGIDVEDNIKTGFKEIGWRVVECIHVTQDKDQWRAVVETVMNLRTV
jgi:hypothetical protein